MSATGRGGERRKNDNYQTPPELAEYLVSLLPIRDGDRCLEPCAGTGAFTRALRQRSSHVDAVDIEPYPDTVQCDFFKYGGAPGQGPYDWIVTNPPYSLAQPFVEHAHELVSQTGTIAMLLRLAFLESAKRVPFWCEYPLRHVVVLAERPSFTGGGTDSSAYGFFIWRPGIKVGLATIEVKSWKSAHRK